MLLSMEYGNFKSHEVDAFELDHMITYKQSSKFTSQNVLMEVNLENFLPQKLPAIRYTGIDDYKQAYKITVGTCVGHLYDNTSEF